MDPHQVFCPNSDCRARGHRGKGNIRVHSHTEQRYRCTLCRKTFSARTGTVFYRRHTPAWLLTVVVALVAHGCPVAAIEAVFGVQARTVGAWIATAGTLAQAVHEQWVQQPCRTAIAAVGRQAPWSRPGEQHGEPALLQQLKDGDPEDPGGFHHDRIDFTLLEPISETVQIGSEGGERANRDSSAARWNGDKVGGGTNVDGRSIEVEGWQVRRGSRGRTGRTGGTVGHREISWG